jgi:hypothetical protein
MNVPHNEGVVAPSVEVLAGNISQVVRHLLLRTMSSFFALAGDAASNRRHQIGVDETGGLDHGWVTENSTQLAIPSVIRDNEVAVRATNLSTLDLYHKIVIVDANTEIVCEESADPVIMVAS